MDVVVVVVLVVVMADLRLLIYGPCAVCTVLFLFVLIFIAASTLQSL